MQKRKNKSIKQAHDHKRNGGHSEALHWLDNPILNKGTAFTERERTKLQLHGLLPANVQTLEKQLARTYEAYSRKTDDLERHIYLRALQDRNEVLFYRLLHEHIEEMLPIIYTPVVAQGCANFSRIYRRPRGLFISYPKRNQIAQILRNRPYRDVDVIVVTDGERVLGIGDQGVGGLGISIGKLSLYTLIGGIHPSRTLPVVLDVGTNNEEHLRSPRYLGWQHERITGERYYEFVDRFVRAIKIELPHACLQWEDFAGTHARPLLERYRGQLCTFNDDIQGTAAVVLGALLSAVKVNKQNLQDQQIVFLGAGAAAVGVADYILSALIAEGLSATEAANKIWMVDSKGLLLADRSGLSAEQMIYAKSREQLAAAKIHANVPVELAEVVERAKATVLIGLSTVGHAFTEETIRTMARNTARPIIFPLSNPTERSEADPKDLIRWTNGSALIATGSPFPPVDWNNHTFAISQCNNIYIFPGVGLALSATRTYRVTDGMLLAAAHALAEHSPILNGTGNTLLPLLPDLRSITLKIAFAVAQQAQKEGLTHKTTSAELRKRLKHNQWIPNYDRIV